MEKLSSVLQSYVEYLVSDVAERMRAKLLRFTALACMQAKS